MRRRTAVHLSVALALATAGCAGWSDVDEHMGEAYQTVTSQMIENPEAGSDDRPVVGLGSSDAAQVSDNRRERSTVEYQDRSKTSPVSILSIEDGN